MNRFVHNNGKVMKKSIAFLSLILIIMLSACNYEAPHPINVKTANRDQLNRLTNEGIPYVASKEWNTASKGKSYSVSIREDNLYVEEAENKNGTNKLEINNGYFLGTNGGEFGGKLTFTSKDNTYTILEENIIGLINFKNTYYVLTGLEHLSMNEGKMYRLEYDNQWTAKQVLDFKSCPYAFYTDSYGFFIVTSDKLLYVQNEKISKILVENAFWKGLYPNSVIYHDICLVIGMRGGIYTYQLSTDQQRWYPIRF